MGIRLKSLPCSQHDHGRPFGAGYLVARIGSGELQEQGRIRIIIFLEEVK